MPTCLTCRYLLRDAPAPGWHQCVFPVPARVPKEWALIHAGVNLDAPFRDCAAWESRAPACARCGGSGLVDQGAFRSDAGDVPCPVCRAAAEASHAARARGVSALKSSSM